MHAFTEARNPAVGRSRHFAQFSDSKTAVAVLWGAMALIYLLTLARLPQPPYDGDSLMRLQQFRDLLHGQSWFDVTQYRMGPPQGAAMHWSRLVDIPLVAIALILRPLFGLDTAVYWATALVPLLYLGAALFLMRAIMQDLGLRGPPVIGGLVLAALFPMLPAAFAPMQIDHHTPQAVAGLACAWLLLGNQGRWRPWLAGLTCAVWLVISIEGLPLVALAAAIYGLEYGLRRERSLVAFLTALAAASTVLSLATRPTTQFTEWCDILLPGHWLTFAAGAAVALALPRLPRQDRAWARLVSLLLLPLVCAPVLLAGVGRCAADPFSSLDPLLRFYWFDHVGEGLPVWRQNAAVALPAIYLVAIVPAGLWAAGRLRLLEGKRAAAWTACAIFATGSALYGLLLIREMLLAQLLALPFAAALLAFFLPRARALRSALARVPATLACLLLVTPAPAALAGQRLAEPVSPQDPRVATARAAAQHLAPCSLETLDRLPAGLVFTTFNAAPAVLAQTHHSVDMGGYHRNAAALHAEIAAFVGNPEVARGILARMHAHYVAVCLDDDSLAVMADGNPGSLAAALMQAQPPAWLVPIPGFENSRLRAYRFTPAETSAPRH